MPDGTTEIIRDYSIDGPIGIGTAIALAVALTAVSAGLLWMQRRALGRWSGAFWILRVTAVCLVLAMLLGPSWVTRYRTTKQQSIALLVDTSDSMDVSDPAESAAQRRWVQAASSDGPAEGALASCDRAAVAIRMASSRCREAQDTLDRHQPLKIVRQRIDAIAAAVDRAVRHLETGRKDVTSSGQSVEGTFERLLQTLDGRVAQDVRHLGDQLDPQALSNSSDLSESLQGISDALSGAERRADRLIRALERDLQDGGQSIAAQGGAGMSRIEQAVHTLAGLHQAAEGAGQRGLSVKRMGFAGQTTSLPAETSWDDLLNAGDSRELVISTETNGGPPACAATNVSAALELLGRAAAAESIRSAILITDGAHNDAAARAPQEVAAALADLPVHVVPIGNTEAPRDVLLHRVDAPKAVVEKDSILIDVIVTAVRCAGESTVLTLRKDGLKIDEQPLTFEKERGDQRTFFSVPADKLGRYEFELSIEPLEEESSTTNNLAKLTVDVVKDTLHILLADRIARWEYRYLDQLFRRDESVTFDKLLYSPEPTATGAIANTGGLPRTAGGWADYDVVILGDLETAQLDEPSQKALDEYVRVRGGNLVVIAGEENMPHRFGQQPLIDLLPVEPSRLAIPSQGVQVALTSAGRDHPALAIAGSPADSERAWLEQFRSLPIYSLSEYSRPKPTAETLIAVHTGDAAFSIESGEGARPENSLLTWHQVGAGRVVYLAAPATYRLRFRRGDRYHHRFWGQLLRWMTATERAAGTETVRIVTDRIRYEQGDRVDVTVRLFGDDGDPVAEATIGAAALLGDGSARQIELIPDDRVPGRYAGSFVNLSPGAYRIMPTGKVIDELLSQSTDKAAAETRISIAPSGSPELANTQCNAALLRQIAEVTGGQVVPPTAIGEILALTAAAPEVSERVERQPLWNRWSLLGVAFACLCTEWIVRKRLGLV